MAEVEWTAEELEVAQILTNFKTIHEQREIAKQLENQQRLLEQFRNSDPPQEQQQRNLRKRQKPNNEQDKGDPKKKISKTQTDRRKSRLSVSKRK